MADRRWPRLLLVGVPVLVALVVVGLLAAQRTTDDGSSSTPDGVEPIDVVASGPNPTTVDDLLALGELVVVATITGTEPGRAITDPQDPTTGIRTTLFELTVDEVIAGQMDPGAIVVEHETALLDGSPITVNGIAPPSAGERGLFVLVGGAGQAFPHHALASPTAWAPLDGDRLRAPAEGNGDHPLGDRTLGEVRAAAGR